MQSQLDLGLPIAFVQALLRILCWFLQTGFVFICGFKFVFQLLFIISISFENTFVLPIYLSLIHDLYDISAISAVDMFLSISFVSFRFLSVSTFILLNCISLIYDLCSWFMTCTAYLQWICFLVYILGLLWIFQRNGPI